MIQSRTLICIADGIWCLKVQQPKSVTLRHTLLQLRLYIRPNLGLISRDHLFQVEPGESVVVAERLSARGPDGREPPGDALERRKALLIRQVRIECLSYSYVGVRSVPQDVDVAKVDKRGSRCSECL